MASEAQPARTESHEGMPLWLKAILVSAVVLAIFAAMPAMIGFFAAYGWIIGPGVAIGSLVLAFLFVRAIIANRERE